MLITFGNTPHDLKVHLAPDADFVQAAIMSPAPPPDASIQLRFFSRTASPSSPPAAVWTATVDDDRAEWHEDKVAVRAVLDAGATQVRLLYVDPSGDELLWAKGKVDAD